MNAGLYPNPRPHLFVSSHFPLVSAGAIANVPHGLAGRPQFVRWVLENLVADQGYVPGDEIPLHCVLDNSNGIVRMNGDANATHVFATCYDSVAAFGVHHKSTGAFTNITSSRWRAKCYAYFFGP